MGVLGNRILLNTSTNNSRDLSGLWYVIWVVYGMFTDVSRETLLPLNVVFAWQEGKKKLISSAILVLVTTISITSNDA